MFDNAPCEGFNASCNPHACIPDARGDQPCPPDFS